MGAVGAGGASRPVLAHTQPRMRFYVIGVIYVIAVNATLSPFAPHPFIPPAFHTLNVASPALRQAILPPLP
eukprot:366427-Chlamydomonas_euryale.AAC.4